MSDSALTPSNNSEDGHVTVPGRNGGRLRRGNPGNRGGRGRAPAEIRATCREKFDTLLPKLERIAKARKSKDADKVRAIDVLGRYGMDRSISIEDLKEALRLMTAEIYDFLPRDQADVLISRIRPIFLKL